MGSAITDAPARVVVDVWSDVLCPWCYLGEHRLRQAIEQTGHGQDFEVRVHTFQLDPHAGPGLVPAVDHLAGKHGISREKALQMQEGMVKRAGREGLGYSVEHFAGNTFDMLRLVHLAAEHGVAAAFLHAVKVEVFTANPRAYEHDTLVALGERFGIPADETRAVLGSDRYADAVAADRAHALSLGATGLPFAVVAGRVGLPGVVGTAQYLATLEDAWREQAEAA